MLIKWFLQTILWIVLLAALLFFSAGTTQWPGAWIFLIETTLVGLLFGIWLARYDPELFKERLQFFNQKDQPFQDKIVTRTLLLFYIVWFPFMGLDVRFNGFTVPSWLQILGALGILVACYIAYLTFRENSFAAPVVKIQKERAQTVIMTGPYRYVRHPMYAGMLFYLFGAPLLFSSWWGLAWTLLLLALFVARIRIEERTLRRELPGYDEYAAKVRYRLIPLIW